MFIFSDIFATTPIRRHHITSHHIYPEFY